MPVNIKAYEEITGELKKCNAQLVAVSKTRTVNEIRALYDLGQRDFGENYVQELMEKQPQLPNDIRWHFIGHLQGNKVKYIASFVHLIHAVDSFKLLVEINKQAVKNNRVIDCLMQVHIASEETKFGFDEKGLEMMLSANFDQLKELKNIRITGLMGMASFSDDNKKVQYEFEKIKSLFDKYMPLRTSNFALQILSIGMSSDYKIAIEQGSTMVRIGSLIFGERRHP
ncbi:MAG: YggS family pyridoxal phosphate-dependent enzyme [Bacteroidetes bacterium]|nr:YggS family pyridoxal phosphate-dependent enzyme [Bacteroidota bacterium]MBS1973127.1 YggS family pyridoxal phosphate-dependent enzyme [Bacteroidota bacterium]